MVLDTSGVSDERRMLTELVEQKLDAYTERKDELVELRTLREGGGSGDIITTKIHSRRRL